MLCDECRNNFQGVCACGFEMTDDCKGFIALGTPYFVVRDHWALKDMEGERKERELQDGTRYRGDVV
jgi:hypothetical protein